MKVLLLKSIPGVGKAGAVIEAKEGYVHNFLLLKGLGKVMTKEVEHERSAKAAKALIHAEELEAFYAEAEGKIRAAGSIVIRRRVSGKGHLFGGVTEKDVAEAIRSQAKVEITAGHVRLQQAIKVVGAYATGIRLGETTVPIEIRVEAE